jgi:hypothetical protein
MKKCDASTGKTESAELEFPDWSGMDDSSARVDPDTAFQLCAHYRSWFPEWAKQFQAQRPEKCLAEFVL